MARASGGSVRLVNVLAMTPVMLAEYVPPDFDVQQRTSAEEALGIIAHECGLDAAHVSATVRQGGIYHEVLEEAKTFNADLIVMSSHRPAMRTYFSAPMLDTSCVTPSVRCLSFGSRTRRRPNHSRGITSLGSASGR